MQRFTRFFFSCFLVTLSFHGYALAQHWTEIGQFYGAGGGTCGFFWNLKTGFVAYGWTDATIMSPKGIPTMYKTTDGHTWTQVSLPSSLKQGIITSIYMHDRKNGWFTTESPANPSLSGIYSTSDSGNTWSAVPAALQWGDILQLPGGQMIYSVGGIAPMNDSVCLISSSAGPFVFSNYIEYNPNGTYGYSENYLTTDAGSHWKVCGPNDDFWGVTYLPSCRQFFEFPTGNSGSVNALFSSSDTGKTWIAGTAIPSAMKSGTTGDIEGMGSALYVQSNSDGNTIGFFRSTDCGQSWKPVGGT